MFLKFTIIIHTVKEMPFNARRKTKVEKYYRFCCITNFSGWDSISSIENGVSLLFSFPDSFSGFRPHCYIFFCPTLSIREIPLPLPLSPLHSFDYGLFTKKKKTNFGKMFLFLHLSVAQV